MSNAENIQPVADTTTKPASKELSPKVTIGTLVGFCITILGGALAAITPNTFKDFGVWGPVIFSAVSVAGMALTGYLKKDPRRK